MTDKDIQRMQRRIDEGIQLAQHRLWERAGRSNLTLVVCRNGKVVEIGNFLCVHLTDGAVQYGSILTVNVYRISADYSVAGDNTVGRSRGLL